VKRLILSLIFAVLATTVGAGWIISQFHSMVYKNTSDIDKTIATYKRLGQSIALTLDKFSEKNEFIAYWETHSDVEISLQALSEFPVPEDLNQHFTGGTPLLLQSDGEMSLHIYMSNSDQVMTMLLPIQNDGDQKTLLNLILTLMFYFFVIMVLLAWLYPLIKRLLMLQNAAEKFGEGDLSSRIGPSKTSYIFEIEKEFNRMAGQIQKLVDDNKLLSRAVSHNLKTPITRLRMGVDVLEEATDQSAIDEYIKRINSDLDEMQSLVETLLRYSSLDEFNIKLNNQTIELRQYISELFENAEADGIDVSLHFSKGNLVINTDPRYLAMQLNNIMSNALQFASNVVEVRVGLHSDDNHVSAVSIAIEDDGVGIPETERDHVTKPFWRGGNDSTIKGHGMGLAIVARLADWLNADLLIRQSTVLGGASISLLFNRS